MGMFTLVIGGSKSGKSGYAENIATSFGGRKLYVATMMPFGEEAHKAIERHRLMREGKGFETVEKYTSVGELADYEGISDTVILLECMGNLCANEMFSGKEAEDKEINDSGNVKYNGNVEDKVATDDIVIDKAVSDNAVVTDKAVPDNEAAIDEAVSDSEVVMDKAILDNEVAIDEVVSNSEVVMDKAILDNKVAIDEVVSDSEVVMDKAILDNEVVIDKIVSNIERLATKARALIVVSNKVGEDGIDYPEETKAYIKNMGVINSRLADMADKVIEMVFGIAVILK